MRLLALNLVTAASFSSIPGHATELKPMRHVVSPSYEVFSRLDERRTGEVVKRLNAFHHLMEKYLMKPALHEPIPTRIFLLRRKDWNRYFEDRRGRIGAFHTTAFGNYLLIDGDSNLTELMPTVFHEYVHYYLHTQFPGDYPAWFDEGIAEVLSTVKFDGTTAVIDPDFTRLLQLRGTSKWMPASSLLRVTRDSPEYTQHRLAQTFYSQSWLLAHYALVQNFEFSSNVFRYIAALNEPGSTIEQAIAEHLGGEAHVDKIMHSYSRRESYVIGALNLSHIDEPKIETSRQLTSFETGLAVAETAIAIGRSDHETIGLIESLVTTAPNEHKGHVIALRAIAASRRGDLVNASNFVNLATKSLHAADIKGYKALAAFHLDTSSSVKDADLRAKSLRQAIDLYERAHELDEKDLEACWGFGWSRLGANVEHAATTQVLADCVKLAPRSAELNHAVALGYGRTGQLQLMRDHLVFATKYARNSRRRAQLRESLRILDEQLKAGGLLQE